MKSQYIYIPFTFNQLFENFILPNLIILKFLVFGTNCYVGLFLLQLLLNVWQTFFVLWRKNDKYVELFQENSVLKKKSFLKASKIYISEYSKTCLQSVAKQDSLYVKTTANLKFKLQYLLFGLIDKGSTKSVNKNYVCNHEYNKRWQLLQVWRLFIVSGFSKISKIYRNFVPYPGS